MRGRHFESIRRWRMNFNLSSFLQMRINFYLIRKLGWDLTYIYIYLLGKLYFFFKRKEKRHIENSITAVFGRVKNKSEIESLGKAAIEGIFSHYYEKIFNAFSHPKKLQSFFETHMRSSGLKALDDGLQKGKGVLLITGHIGGVEYIPPYLGSKNYPATIVVRFSSRHLKSMSFEQAEHFGVKIIDVDSTPNIMKAIGQHLKENRIVIMQCDEIDEWRFSRKDKIFFLGKETYLDRTINIMTKRMAAPIVFGVMHRESTKQYHFIATSWEEMAKRFQHTLDTSIGAVVLKFIERHILSYPYEWYQWKKYPRIETVPSFSASFSENSGMAVFESSLNQAYEF